MTYFAVIREHGPGWDGSRSLEEQEGWDEHAAVMDALVEDGFVILGGPLGDGERVLLAVRAQSAEAVRERLEADPWSPTGQLWTASVEPWTLRLGEPAAPR